MNPTLPVLERMTPPAHLAVPKHLDGDLAERAAKDLGYKPLKDAAQGFKLLGTLLGLRIMPFTDASVARYMATAKKHANRRRTIAGCIMAGVMAIGALMMTLSCALSPTHLADSPDVTFGVGLFIFVVGLVVGVTFFPERKAWFRSDLNGYGRPVPTSALQTALRIREAMPEAQFRVHELDTIKSVDPFLSVTAGSETYFIAVWDEPGFSDESQNQ